MKTKTVIYHDKSFSGCQPHTFRMAPLLFLNWQGWQPKNMISLLVTKKPSSL